MEPIIDPHEISKPLFESMPINQGGAIAQAGFGYQASCSIEEIITAHATLSDQYILLLDLHEDIVVITSNGIKFIQVKTTSNSCFKWNQLLSKDNSGSSIFSKLYYNTLKFPNNVNELVLLSNKPFLLNQDNNTRIKNVVDSFKISTLDPQLRSEFHKHIGSTFSKNFDELEYCPFPDNFTYCIKSHLDTKTHHETMLGRVILWLETLGYVGTDQHRAFYRALKDEIIKRAEIKTTSPIDSKRKSLNRSDVEKLINCLCKSNHEILRQKTITCLDNNYTQEYPLHAKRVLDKYVAVDLPNPYFSSLNSLSELVSKAIHSNDPNIINATSKREIVSYLLQIFSEVFGDHISSPVHREIILMYEVIRAQEQ